MPFDSYFLFHGKPVFFADIAAIVWYVTAWLGYAHYAQKHYPRSRNLVSITGQMRMNWMRQMLRRDNRMVDAALIGNLLRGITFFASTSIFVLIGLVTMLGYRDKALEIITSIPFTLPSSEFLWEAKIFVMAFMFIYAFFKYTWSLRLYNYACILVGAAPMPPDYEGRPEAQEFFAERASKLIANAGQHFNLGLRAYYFGLAVLSWFLHPLLFILITAWVVYEVHRREFRSHAVNNLIEIVSLTDPEELFPSKRKTSKAKPKTGA